MRRTLVIALMLTVTILSVSVGGTIAWFTDSATSGNNVIASGNLDLAVSYKDGEEWKDLEADNAEPLFNYNKWEPGYAVHKTVKLENKGNLAFKYQLNIEGATTEDAKKLAGVIDVYMFDAAPADRAAFAAGTKVGTLAELIADENGAAYGVLLPEGETADASNPLEVVGSKEVTIGLKMQESAGNEYQNLSMGALTLNVMATQYTHEKDSFGDDYDADASYVPMTYTLEDLRAALAEGGNIVLGADIVVNVDDMLFAADGGHSDGSAFFVKADSVLDLNGHDITINTNNLWADVFFMNFGADLTIKGDGDITANCSTACVYDANSTLNVEGGNYFVTVNNDMLYAIYGKINVSGGTFTTSYWNTINIYGSGRTELVDVSGGSFEGWNPATSPDGNLLANGYKSVSEVIDGVTWYNVVPE